MRRYGAGGATAISEAFFAIGAIDNYPDTHPPGLLRIRYVLDLAGTPTEPRLAALLQPWEELVPTTPVFGEDWIDHLVRISGTLTGDIDAIVGSWGVPKYDTDDRAEVICGLADLLKQGIPGDQVITTTAAGPVEVVEADVLNASWIGRVEDFATPTARLAGKCVEDVDFVDRWKAAGGLMANRSAPTPTPPAPSGVLSELQIAQRVFGGGPDRLVVTPILPDAMSGTGLDLRLGNRFIVFTRTRTAAYDPLDKKSNPRAIQRRTQLDWSEQFVLHPGELVLAATLEYLVLPGDLSAQVITRSSYGRLGLLSATAVQIHPHFHGCLTLELVNLGNIPLRLTPGERVAQLVLSKCGHVVEPVGKKYQYAVGPQFSAVPDDVEAGILRTIAGIE